MAKKATDRQIDAVVLKFKHMLWLSNDIPSLRKSFHNEVARSIKALYKAYEILNDTWAAKNR